MDLSIFPTEAAAVGTIAGAAILAMLFIEWIKKYLPDWRYTNLLALVLALVLVELAMLQIADELTLWQRLYRGFLLAFAGASLPTFGRELLLNLAGLAGIGPRSTPTK